MTTSPARRIALLSGLMTIAPISAYAAEPAMVSKVSGKQVTWQSGDKTSAPRVQTLLSPGDRLAAGKGSFVEIEYLADSCTIRVKSGGSITIGDTSPCAAAADQKAEAATSKDPASGKSSDQARIIPAAAGAVEVMDKKGPVARVNLGDGLVDASVGDALKAGDEVFAGANSSVTLYYAVPGCSYTVPAGNVFKVSSKSPCKAPAAAQNGNAPVPPQGVATAAIAGGGVAVVPAAQDDASSDSDGDRTAAIVGGGVAVVAAIALVVSLTTDDGDGGNNNVGGPATPN